MGVLALFSPTAVQRQADTCTHCLQCSRICPSNLPVHREKRVFSQECSGCFECVNACPSAGTLSLKTTGLGALGWNPSRLALAVGLAFAVMVFTAQISGHWKSAISDDEFKMFLRMVDSPALIHPTF